jgi:hypothetical protein
MKTYTSFNLKLPHENSDELLFPLKLETFLRNRVVIDAEKLETFFCFKLRRVSLLNSNFFQKQQEQFVEFTASSLT